MADLARPLGLVLIGMALAGLSLRAIAAAGLGVVLVLLAMVFMGGWLVLWGVMTDGGGHGR